MERRRKPGTVCQCPRVKYGCSERQVHTHTFTIPRGEDKYTHKHTLTTKVFRTAADILPVLRESFQLSQISLLFQSQEIMFVRSRERAGSSRDARRREQSQSSTLKLLALSLSIRKHRALCTLNNTPHTLATLARAHKPYTPTSLARMHVTHHRHFTTLAPCNPSVPGYQCSTAAVMQGSPPPLRYVFGAARPRHQDEIEARDRGARWADIWGRSSGRSSRARTACRGPHAPRRPRYPKHPPPPVGG